MNAVSQVIQHEEAQILELFKRMRNESEVNGEEYSMDYMEEQLKHIQRRASALRLWLIEDKQFMQNLNEQ